MLTDWRQLVQHTCRVGPLRDRQRRRSGLWPGFSMIRMSYAEHQAESMLREYTG